VSNDGTGITDLPRDCSDCCC